MPTRDNDGTISFSCSRRFAESSADMADKPVMLPPGRARLWANPDPTGSAIRGDTIGTWEVTDLAAMMAGVDADDDPHAELDQFARESWKPAIVIIGPAIIEDDGLAVVVAERMHSFAERAPILTVLDATFRLGIEDANMRNFCVGSRGGKRNVERPWDGSATEKRDEVSAFHSITSSARASSVAGTARPSALAV